MSCCKDKRYIVVEIEEIHRVIDVWKERLKGSYTDEPSAYQAICGFLLEDLKKHRCKKGTVSKSKILLESQCKDKKGSLVTIDESCCE
jgi:hypothetical protein